MTKDELLSQIEKNHMQMLLQLRERWNDEYRYEDINEYLDYIKKVIPQAFAITKRPFGVKFKADDGIFKINIAIKGNKYLTTVEEYINSSDSQ